MLTITHRTIKGTNPNTRLEVHRHNCKAKPRSGRRRRTKSKDVRLGIWIFWKWSVGEPWAVGPFLLFYEGWGILLGFITNWPNRSYEIIEVFVLVEFRFQQLQQELWFLVTKKLWWKFKLSLIIYHQWLNFIVTNIIYNSDKKRSCHYNFIISDKKIFVTNIYIFYFHI